jgi:PAS domain S-box-containing protein
MMSATDPRVVARFERGSRMAGIGSAVLGALVLLGWSAGLEPLKNPAHMAAMKPNTAASFLMAGIALVFAAKDAPRWQRITSRVLAATTATISALTLAEYLFSVNLGIDELLFKDTFSAFTPPGRMAFVTGFSFLLLGLAVELIDVRARGGERPSEWLAAISLLPVLFGAADYALDWSPELTGIALHTVIGLMVLGVGVLAARSAEGWAKTVTSARAGGAAARRLLPFAFAVPLVVGMLRWMGERAGFYSAESGVAIMVSSTTSLLAVAILWNARQLNQAEEQRLIEANRANRELRRMNRALGAMNHCRQALLHAETEAALVHEMCRVVVDDGGYRMAWVGYPEQDNGKHVRFAAHHGAAEDYPQKARITWDESDRGSGPTGTAIRTGEIQICHDILTERRMLPWRDMAIAHGLRSTSVFPLKHGAATIGALSIYSADADAFQAEEVDLLGKLADDLAYGIVSLRARAEHERVQGALRDSEDKFRHVFENSSAGKSLTLPTGQLQANSAFAEMLGYSTEEFTSLTWRDITHPGDIPATQKLVDEIVAGKSDAMRMQKRYLHKDGSVVWVELSSTARRDRDGRLQYLMSTVLDITERKRMEQELEAERQRFSDVLDRLPAYVILLAPDYTVPFANKFFRDRFGESGGRRCYEYLFERDSPCEVCESFKVLRDGEPRKWEWVGPDGHDYEIYDYLFRENGKDLILEMGIDVTERKRAEREVELASRYARSLLEASLDPLVTISKPGRIMDVNRATELVTGYDRERLIGSDFSDFFTEPEKARKGYQRVFAEGEVRDYPLSIRHLSGPVTEVLYNAAVYRNADGEIEGIFAAARDITERKRAEEALEHRTAELERSNKELQDFASIASHDLQEPLRKVMAFGDRLRAQAGAALDETGNDYLNRMQNAAVRMSLLVEALLDYSRVTTKARPFERVDLNAVAADVLSDLETRIQESGARVEVGSLPTIMADVLQMRQLLQNLIANALKFHPPDRPPHVAVSAMPSPGGSWSIAVQDHGVGFDEAYTDRIFRPFQRLYGRAEFPGSGMGLAICRKIVDRHGGTIEARSRPGEGFVFTFTLPSTHEQGATHADAEAEYDFNRRG